MKNRHLTDEEKRINRLRKKWENDPHDEAKWRDWYDTDQAFIKTEHGALVYHAKAVASLAVARFVPVNPDAVYVDGYDRAKGLLQNAKLLAQLAEATADHAA